MSILVLILDPVRGSSFWHPSTSGLIVRDQVPGELVQGYPWLTNALADQIVGRDVNDRSIPITTLHIESAECFGHREAGPHLMLMAFLQRIVNGDGRVEREYGLAPAARSI